MPASSKATRRGQLRSAAREADAYGGDADAAIERMRSALARLSRSSASAPTFRSCVRLLDHPAFQAGRRAHGLPRCTSGGAGGSWRPRLRQPSRLPRSSCVRRQTRGAQLPMRSQRPTPGRPCRAGDAERWPRVSLCVGAIASWRLTWTWQRVGRRRGFAVSARPDGGVRVESSDGSRHAWLTAAGDDPLGLSRRPCVSSSRCSALAPARAGRAHHGSPERADAGDGARDRCQGRRRVQKGRHADSARSDEDGAAGSGAGDGTVASVHCREGELVQPGTVLVELDEAGNRPQPHARIRHASPSSKSARATACRTRRRTIARPTRSRSSTG